MAEGGIIGALRVVLGLDSASLDKGLKKSRSDMDAFGATMGAIGKTIAVGLAAGAAAIGGIGLAVHGAIGEMDKMLELSQSIGVPVEELSALKHAAELSGVGIEALGKSMGKLSKSMVEASTNAKSDVARTFKDLGVEVTNADGSLKSASQVLTDIAGKFAGAKDGAAKTAASMILMGKSGAEMIPLLNSGAAGLKEMMEEAQQLGLVFDTKTAQAADKFNDTLTSLSRVKDGVIIRLTAHMLPALQRFAQFMLDGAKNSDLLKNVATALTRVFDGLIRAFMLVSDNFRIILKLFAIFLAAQVATGVVAVVVAFVRLARAIQAAGLMMAAFNVVKSIGVRGILLLAGAVALATGQFDNMVAKLKEIGTRINEALPDDLGETFKRTVKALGFDLSALEKDLTSFDASGGGAKKALDNIKLSGDGAKGAVDKAKDSLEKLKEEGKATFEQTRTPAEAYVETLKKLDAQLKAGAISAETHGRAVSMAKNEMIKATPAAQMLETALSSAFDRFLDFSMSAIDQLKQFGRELAKMAAMAAFKALMWGPQSGMSGSGLLGNLFGSAGSFLPAFAHGGSFKVGGSGGVDSQVRALRLTPGERVDVRTPGQQRDMGGGPVNVDARTRIVNAFDGPSFLSEALASPVGEKVMLNFVRANSGAFRAAQAS